MTMVGAIAAPRPAWAAGPPEPIDLSWAREAGAESCPDEARIAAEVAARVGRDPFSRAARRSIRASVRRILDQWSVRIEERDGDRIVGARDLPSAAPDCAPVSDAAVLVLALLVDPAAALAPPRAVAPPPPAAPDPSLPVRRAVAAEPAPPSPPSTAWPRVAILARGGAAFGVTPRPAGLLALSAAVEWPRFEVTAEMRWVPDSRATSGEFSVGLTAGALGACFIPVRFARGSLGMCGAFLAGATHDAFLALEMYEPVNPGQQFWAAAALSARLRVALWSPFTFEIGAEGFAPFVRYGLTKNGQPIFIPPPLGAIPFAGIGLSIP